MMIFGAIKTHAQTRRRRATDRGVVVVLCRQVEDGFISRRDLEIQMEFLDKSPRSIFCYILSPFHTSGSGAWVDGMMVREREILQRNCTFIFLRSYSSSSKRGAADIDCYFQ